MTFELCEWVSVFFFPTGESDRRTSVFFFYFASFLKDGMGLFLGHCSRFFFFFFPGSGCWSCLEWGRWGLLQKDYEERLILLLSSLGRRGEKFTSPSHPVLTFHGFLVALHPTFLYRLWWLLLPSLPFSFAARILITPSLSSTCVCVGLVFVSPTLRLVTLLYSF